MVRASVLALVGAVALGVGAIGCAGGGLSGEMPFSAGEGVQTVGDAAALAAHNTTPSQNALGAILVTNAIGARIRDTGDQGEGGGDRSAAGKCKDGFEFFAPDRLGTPDSTEALSFYDPACTQLARDAVRLYGPASGGENVTRTLSLYARGKGTPFAVRTQAMEYTQGVFDAYGYPKTEDGFVREAQGQLTVDSAKTILSDTETVVLPGTAKQTTFCEDSAGYNATGFPALDATIGWQGGTAASHAATRSVQTNGDVTFASVQSGTSYVAPAGDLSIAAGPPNGVCPIGTPAYALAGGTTRGTYTIPLLVTYDRDEVRDLWVHDATFADGYALSVRTTHAGRATAISGIVSADAAKIGTFDVDGFGNGWLTVVSSGTLYRIVDWLVVR